MKILLALTFVYGVLGLLTYTKVFSANLVNPIKSILPYGNKYWLAKVLEWFDTVLFYFSLIFQAWYWLFR